MNVAPSCFAKSVNQIGSLSLYRSKRCGSTILNSDKKKGGTLDPICLVAHEMNSSTTLRLWESELLGLSRPPFDLGRENLFVAYFATAELNCHLALGWPLPANVLDLYAEFRCLVNGLPTPHGRGLLGALAWFGLDHIDVTEKEAMRELALRGGPWSEEEKRDLLDYCESDVIGSRRN